LRFTALLACGTLFFLAGRAFAGTNADAPTGKPNASIDLAQEKGVALVKGQWRYSDTKIIEVDFKSAGPDKQPTGAPNKTYDYSPHAGGADFDDSKWQVIEPTTLDGRRSTGRTPPGRISTAVFRSSIGCLHQEAVECRRPASTDDATS